MSVNKLLPLALLLVVESGCGSLHAPRASVPKPEAAGREVFGAWAIIRFQPAGAAVLEAEGELIAVNADTLWLLLPAPTPLAIPTASVQRAEVTGFDSAPGTLIALGALGTLTTISNGAFLLFTAPGWAIASAVASSAQAKQSRREAVGRDLQPLALFARYPQGLPPGLNLNVLRSRPRP